MSDPTYNDRGEIPPAAPLLADSPDIAKALRLTRSYHRFTPWFELADWARRRESVASFLIGVALATLKEHERFREQQNPETGRPFASFTEYARHRFPNVQDHEGIDLTRQEVDRLSTIGRVYIRNREMFESKGFDPYRHYSKLRYWEAATDSHPELTPPELYDKMIAATKDGFETFSNGRGDGPSTHVHSVYDTAPFRFCHWKDSITRLTHELMEEYLSKEQIHE